MIFDQVEIKYVWLARFTFLEIAFWSKMPLETYFFYQLNITTNKCYNFLIHAMNSRA